MESKEFEASMHVTTHNELQEQCQTLAAEQEQCKEQIAALKAKLFAVTNAEVRQQGKKAKRTGTCPFQCALIFLGFCFAAHQTK